MRAFLNCPRRDFVTLQIPLDIGNFSPPLESGWIEFADANGLTPSADRETPPLTDALRSRNVDSSAFGRELSDAKAELSLPRDFDQLGPKARIIALQSIAPASQPLLRFLSAGSQANIFELVRHTLPSVASGDGVLFVLLFSVGNRASPADYRSSIALRLRFHMGKHDPFTCAIW